ncbi:MAG: hypothetical protein GY827_11785 [Cytophagales bacterium]|nr:hypothetical protein [Cytophagales bacterium]
MSSKHKYISILISFIITSLIFCAGFSYVLYDFDSPILPGWKIVNYFSDWIVIISVSTVLGTLGIFHLLHLLFQSILSKKKKNM